MAKKRALKVFRTSTGFDDAYVAAPSQKAALAAWGTDKNLFARGDAEVVTDPTLAEAALAAPGTVVRRPKGTTADHLAAARAAPAADTAGDRGHRGGKRASSRPVKRSPRPGRDALDAAQTALAERQAALDADLRDVDGEIEALRTRRHELRAAGDREIAGLRQRADTAKADYRAAVDRWMAEGGDDP